MPADLVAFDLDGLTFTMTPEVATSLQRGELDADVGYMQGRIKVAGDMARFYDLLPLARSDEFQRRLRASLELS
jgi:hypothetical protein